MKHSIRAALATAFLVGGMAATAAPALAGPPPPPNLICHDGGTGGADGMSAVPSQAYNNVTIPAGDTCTLDNNAIQGTVSGGAGSTLNVENATTIAKDVNLASGSSLNTPSAGNVFNGNVTLTDGAGIAVGNGGNAFNKDLSVSGLSGNGNFICRAYIGHNLRVAQLAAGSDVNVGDTTSNGAISSGTQQCSIPDAVAGNVDLDQNAGLFAAQFGGGSESIPAAKQTTGFCPVKDASNNNVAGWVGNNYQADSNTNGFFLDPSNVCHDLTANGNASGPNTNSVTSNNTRNNFNANNDTGTNSITGNHADHDATCRGDDPTVSGNTAAHKNSCPAPTPPPKPNNGPNLVCSDTSTNGGMPAGTGPYNNVTIPANNTCTLSGLVVNGTITGNTGSTLNITGTSVGHDVNMAQGTTFNASGGGNTFQADVNITKGSLVTFDSGNTVALNVAVTLLNTANNQDYICATSVGKNISVSGLASGGALNVGDTSVNAAGMQCGMSDDAGGNVSLDSNAGPISDSLTGGPAAPATGYCSVQVVNPTPPPATNPAAAMVGGSLENNGNTGGILLESTNVCHDINANSNVAPAGALNTVTSNTAGNNFTANNDTGHNPGTPSVNNNISANHADHDAHCTGDSQTVNGNSAGHTNSCPNNP